MAYFSDACVNDFDAASDLSALEYRAVRLSSGNVVSAVNATSAILGALTDDVEDFSSEAGSVPVRTMGIGKVKVGTSGATENTFGTAEADGWTDASTGNFYGCYFLETGAAGAVISALIVQGQLD